MWTYYFEDWFFWDVSDKVSHSRPPNCRLHAPSVNYSRNFNISTKNVSELVFFIYHKNVCGQAIPYILSVYRLKYYIDPEQTQGEVSQLQLKSNYNDQV